MHALRLWCLFSHSVCIRLLLMVITVGYHATEWTVVIQFLQSNMQAGGRTWLPSLVVHAILYLLTVVRAFTPKPPKEKRDVMNRVLWEGAILASVSFGTSLFDAIGAFESDPRVSIPARYTEVMLAIMSVTMSRVMFNIRMLSASRGTDPEQLLSHLEMSRVKCTRGEHQGELLVEVDNVGPDEYELSHAEADVHVDIGENLCVATPSFEKITEIGLNQVEVRYAVIDDRSPGLASFASSDCPL
ncbi:hypothetical protein NEOLEDRAFT_1137602 [Neolentinus lepideus HHB14362 ss-1]|uniref:Uncharacterized protein n=1 Tax=Neolentinus lepideus HHB14362 ss-1 TaxID=1314782 RepID=A0A165QMD7_9AGAM|nr:hypothetical protein NEOLEDRAFT_1137602 [Neolentinus lepideus HHB14362 ss-1]